MSLPTRQSDPADHAQPEAAAPAPQPLSTLRCGEGRVVQVEAEAADASRLKALGICIGRRVLVVQAGDPLIVKVVGSRVGLSARLAAGVFVVAADASAGATTAA
ncbi:MAG: ferrous iron transport protein A [Pirellulales bacterium]|nr:ferrous iron transport protein A [Pirellulales bacterium]